MREGSVKKEEEEEAYREARKTGG